jgi:hypothetical protein
MKIQVRQPYKIHPAKLKRYEMHYNIPASQAVIVPLKELDDEVSCDVRWQDAAGNTYLVENTLFIKANLIPINSMLDDQLYDIWNFYYNNHEKGE